MVACVPKNPDCLSHSAITSPELRYAVRSLTTPVYTSSRLDALHHSGLFQFGDGTKSSLGHPLNCVSCLVTAALLSVDQDMYREGRRPSRTCSGFIEEAILDD